MHAIVGLLALGLAALLGAYVSLLLALRMGRGARQGVWRKTLNAVFRSWPPARLFRRATAVLLSFLLCGTEVLDTGLPHSATAWDEAQARYWISGHAPRQTRDYVAQVQAAAQRHLAALLAAQAPPLPRLASAFGAP